MAARYAAHMLSSTMLALVLATAALAGPGEDGTWLTNHGKAEVLARVRQRPLLALFTGSDWCGWCKLLQAETLSRKEFKSFAAANLVLVEVDFPSRKPQGEMEKKINGRLLGLHDVEGFPTLVLFDAKGKELGRTGYVLGGAPALIAKLRGLMKR